MEGPSLKRQLATDTSVCIHLVVVYLQRVKRLQILIEEDLDAALE